LPFTFAPHSPQKAPGLAVGCCFGDSPVCTVAPPGFQPLPVDAEAFQDGAELVLLLLLPPEFQLVAAGAAEGALLFGCFSFLDFFVLISMDNVGALSYLVAQPPPSVVPNTFCDIFTALSVDIIEGPSTNLIGLLPFALQRVFDGSLELKSKPVFFELEPPLDQKVIFNKRLSFQGGGLRKKTEGNS